MKKITIAAIIVFVGIISFSFTGKSINEGEDSVAIITRNGSNLLVSYGNNKSEIVEFSNAVSDKGIISSNEILIKQLNKLEKEGYTIKTLIPKDEFRYSIILEKK